MHEVEKIGVVSMMKYQAIIPTIFALVFALPLLVLEAAAPGAGFVTYLFVVIGTAVGGAIAGALMAVIYNVVAGIIGGIELELGEV